jgi:2-polyprenyl-3-methyl-5-hydroxy-6-metoxy-1,4-benzoquinol methylase
MISLASLYRKEKTRFVNILARVVDRNAIQKIERSGGSDLGIKYFIEDNRMVDIPEESSLRYADYFQSYYRSSDKILDYGCGEGIYIESVGQHLDIPKENVYACDIRKEFNKGWKKSREGRRMVYEDIDEKGRIPFNVKFNVISINMVLRHIPAEKLGMTLIDIREHLRHDGKLIIRDNDCCNDIDYQLIGFDHFLHSSKWEELYLHSFTDWDEILRKYGFKLEYKAKTFGPDRQFTACYRPIT